MEFQTVSSELRIAEEIKWFAVWASLGWINWLQQAHVSKEKIIPYSPLIQQVSSDQKYQETILAGKVSSTWIAQQKHRRADHIEIQQNHERTRKDRLWAGSWSSTYWKYRVLDT